MIFRVEKTQNYTVMSNFHLKEQGMTLKAKGLLCMMLSLPDEWDYSITGLVAICKENETAIKSALKELQEFGYLEIIKHTPDETDTGRFKYEYVVYEEPKLHDNGQNIEKQGVENLALENQGQLNTNKLNTKDIYIYSQVIKYLNEKTCRRYRVTDKVRRLISARIREGATLEDFKSVIDKKCTQWLNDEKMNMYLRPETLFGTKFQGYLNQSVASSNPFMDILRSAT